MTDDAPTVDPARRPHGARPRRRATGAAGRLRPAPPGRGRRRPLRRRRRHLRLLRRPLRRRRHRRHLRRRRGGAGHPRRRPLPRRAQPPDRPTGLPHRPGRRAAARCWPSPWPSCGGSSPPSPTLSDIILGALVARRTPPARGRRPLDPGHRLPPPPRRRWRCGSSSPATGCPTSGSTPSPTPTSASLVDEFGLACADLPVVLAGATVLRQATPGARRPAPRPHHRVDPAALLRPHRGRRRPGRPRRLRLRRLGRAVHPHGRVGAARRAGRHQLPHRELPRLPGRRLRRRAHRPGHDPGAQVRGRRCRRRAR